MDHSDDRVDGNQILDISSQCYLNNACREPSHHFVVAPGREIDPKKSVCLSLITLYRNDIARTRPAGPQAE